MTATRRSVEFIATGKNRYGAVHLLKITYKDGRVSHAVSECGGIALFGGNESSAKTHFSNTCGV